MDCRSYGDLRKKMFDVVKRVMLNKNEEIEDVITSEVGKQRIFGALMGGEGVEDYEMRTELWGAAMEYCRAAMRRRNHIVVNYLDQRT